MCAISRVRSTTTEGWPRVFERARKACAGVLGRLRPVILVVTKIPGSAGGQKRTTRALGIVPPEAKSKDAAPRQLGATAKRPGGGPGPALCSCLPLPLALVDMEVDADVNINCPGERPVLRAKRQVIITESSQDKHQRVTALCIVVLAPDHLIPLEDKSVSRESQQKTP
ncbi:hypothetical protein OH77DRAFT_585916 [Trametes cingulata]|nr:hypothetical protein OH77DRAFT_585916 [Trametes cingulata]